MSNNSVGDDWADAKEGERMKGPMSRGFRARPIRRSCGDSRVRSMGILLLASDIARRRLAACPDELWVAALALWAVAQRCGLFCGLVATLIGYFYPNLSIVIFVDAMRSLL